jgi:hypothetical protein
MCRDMPWDLMNDSISEGCERAYDAVVMIPVYRQRGRDRRANGDRTCDRLCLLGVLGHLAVCLLGARRREECCRKDFR